jgi:NADP-dependent 3-hydroxy acid dehydrogenase YdfG
MSEHEARVVVVTGASAGIGEATSLLLASRGARVVLAARRGDKLAEVASRCGANVLPVVADVTVRADHEKLLASALEHFGHVDAWINNAGRGISRQVSELTDEDLDDMMAVNVKSALYGMQTALGHFRARKKGHIVNVSSMLGRVPFAPVRSAYSAAKHALNSLTANLRMELRAELPDVNVSTVHPGVVATEFGLNALHGGFDSRSMPGAQSAQEVAEVIAELLAKPRADVYTRPGAREMVAAYYAAEDMGDVESKPPFMPPTRR